MTYKQGKLTGILITVFVVILLFLFVVTLPTSSKETKVLAGNTVKDVNVTKEKKTVYTYTYSFPITDAMENQYLCFHTLNASVIATVGDRNVYIEDTLNTKENNMKYASMKWHFVHILPQYCGKLMTVRVHAYTEAYKMNDMKMYTGYFGDVIIELMLQILPELLLNSILFILSIIIGVIYMLQKHNKIHIKPSTLWLSIGGFVFVVFVLSSTILAQLILNNQLLQFYIYYLLLYLIPLVLLNYISNLLPKLDTVVEFYIIIITDLVLLLSQITRTYDFTQSIYVYLIILAVVFIAIILKIVLLKKKDVLVLLSYMYIALLVGIIINALIYINDRTILQPFIYMQIILIAFMLLNIYYSTITLVKDIDAIQENNIYREIALKDKLTGLYNRYAFENDVASITEKDLEHIGIVSMDINNLKYYNDNYGHLTGDQLIKEAAALISSVFTRVYRTGGDEFVAIVDDDTVEVLDEKKESLIRKTIKYNKDEKNTIVIEIATGYSKYKFGDKTYEQILTRSDAAMYKHKEQLKSRSVIKSVR